MPRFFHLIEAEKRLPEVERLVRTMVVLKQEYQEAGAELDLMGHRISLAGGMIPPRDAMLLLRHRKDSAGRSLKMSMQRLQEIGCYLKDLDTGLIDFPTLYHSQEVYLCWKLGELAIGFWHPIDDGFAGRRPIDSDFLKNHCGDE